MFRLFSLYRYRFDPARSNTNVTTTGFFRSTSLDDTDSVPVHSSQTMSSEAAAGVSAVDRANSTRHAPVRTSPSFQRCSHTRDVGCADTIRVTPRRSTTVITMTALGIRSFLWSSPLRWRGRHASKRCLSQTPAAAALPCRGLPDSIIVDINALLRAPPCICPSTCPPPPSSARWTTARAAGAARIIPPIGRLRAPKAGLARAARGETVGREAILASGPRAAAAGRAAPSAGLAPVARAEIALDTVVVRAERGAEEPGAGASAGGGTGARNGRLCHDTGLDRRASRCSTGASVAFALGAAVAGGGCSRPSGARARSAPWCAHSPSRRSFAELGESGGCPCPLDPCPRPVTFDPRGRVEGLGSVPLDLNIGPS